MARDSLMRRFRRSDVRNVTFVELLFVIVFTLLLVLSFSFGTLTKAQVDRNEARKAYDNQKMEVAKVQNELDFLRPLGDPKRLSRLRDVDALSDEEQELTRKVQDLKQKAKRYEEFTRLKNEAAREGQDLLADLRELSALKPEFEKLRSTLEALPSANARELIGDVLRQLEERERVISGLTAATDTAERDVARRLEDLAHERDRLRVELARRVAELTNQRDEVRRNLDQRVVEMRNEGDDVRDKLHKLEQHIAELTEKRDRTLRELEQHIETLGNENRDLARDLKRSLAKQVAQAATTGGGGRGLRRCWEEDGKVIRTFDIYIQDANLRAIPARPRSYASKARRILHIMAMANRRLDIK